MRGDASVPRWERLSTETVHDGWIRLRRERWRLPSGLENDWDVLEQGDVVSVIAVTEHDTAVLFDQFRVGPDRVLAEIPGGFLDAGETPVEAGVRELLEETGYSPGAVFVAEGEWIAGSSTRRKHVVVASGCVRVQDPEWEETENGVVREVPLPELVEHVVSGDLSDAGAAARGLLAFARAASVPVGMESLRARIRGLLIEPSAPR
jgi:8-oxo-dGTP pyrophosphatase MutT (NUDIX family)